MLRLLGGAVIVMGFMLRLNALLVVTLAAVVTGLAAGLEPLAVIAAFGKAFNDARYVSAIWLVLPVIGLLERFGLQERAKLVIGGFRSAPVGRLQIGRASCRERVCQHVEITVVAGSLKKKQT